MHCANNKWSFWENSRLRCFVANFIADGFTRFLCYFLGAKSAFVLIFTLLECLDDDDDDDIYDDDDDDDAPGIVGGSLSSWQTNGSIVGML